MHEIQIDVVKDLNIDKVLDEVMHSFKPKKLTINIKDSIKAIAE